MIVSAPGKTLRTRAVLLAVFIVFAGQATRVEAGAWTAGRLGQQNTSVRTTEMTGRVDNIERPLRMITVVTPEHVKRQLYVPTDIPVYESLKVGDVVTVRYTETTIARVNRSASSAPMTDTTAEARKAGGDVLQQLKVTVKIEEIDRHTGLVRYRTADDMIGMRNVADLKLLDGVNPGDTVEIVYTRERAVSVTPAKAQ